MRIALALLGAWLAVGQKIDCLPILVHVDEVEGIPAPYLGDSWFEENVTERWTHVEQMCEGCTGAACIGGADLVAITNCEWVAAVEEEPRCIYKAEHRWTAGDTTKSGDMMYQTISRDSTKVDKQFPNYGGTGYPDPVTKLRVTFHEESTYRLRLRIEDPDEARFEVPWPWGRMMSPTLSPEYATDSKQYKVTLVEGATNDFKFDIDREGGKSGVHLMHSDYPGFVFDDQLLQLTVGIPSDFVYGFGEHEHTTFKHDFTKFSRFTMYTRPHGVSPGPNLYGHHPFYMCLDESSDAKWNAHGVLFLNANAQEIDKIPASGTDWPNLMTFRTLGGIFDFYFFLGPTAEKVVQQYMEAIGRPYLVPYWSLGYHLSQYWYGNLTTVKELHERMLAAEIPWDVQHHDIDYMDHQKDFTVDPISYEGLGDWDREIQAEGMRVVIMLDPALAFGHVSGYNARPPAGDVPNDPDYDATDTGFDLDIWVMIADKADPSKMVPLVGKVWPDKPQVSVDEKDATDGKWIHWALAQLEARKDDEDYSDSERDAIHDALDNWADAAPDDKNSMMMCHIHLNPLWNFQVHMCRAQLGFPDFWRNSAHVWWKAHLKLFQEEEVPYDAIWIDMNEPENFVHGSYNYYVAEDPEDFTWEGGACPETRWDYPPYVPREWDYIRHGGVFVKSLCSSATQLVHGVQMKQYDIHSLYGAAFSEPTWEAVREVTGKRSFVFSRSTYPGVGQYIGHWLGDNWSGWNPLKYSIIGSLEFNLFGIPYVGADVCGFFGDTFDDLCMRWTQLGAFYGFWRNHNAKYSRWQDPANFTTDFSAAAKRVHETRYSLLPYIYTLFYDAHVTGSTVARSYMGEFLTTDSDPRIKTADEQFLMGSSLLVAPALDHTEADEEEDKKAKPEVDLYLPNLDPACDSWYDFYKGTQFKSGEEVKLHIPLYAETEEAEDGRYVMRDIGLFTRCGSVIPMQASAQNTHIARKNPLDLLVTLTSAYDASGKVFWDDGDSQDTVERGEFHLSTVGVSKKDDNIHIRFKVQNHFDVVPDWGKITIYGATAGLAKADFHLVEGDTEDLGRVIAADIGVETSDVGDHVVMVIDLKDEDISCALEGVLVVSNSGSCPTTPPCPTCGVCR